MIQPARQHQQDCSTLSPLGESLIGGNQLFTFKEAMAFLRVSRSTLYRLMWSGQLTGHKVGATWRFYQDELQACIQFATAQPTGQANDLSSGDNQVKALVTTHHVGRVGR